MKKIINISTALLLAGVSMNAQSFEFNEEKVYAGGGLGYNSLDLGTLDSAIGYQFFAGYDLNDDVKISDKIGLSAEVGYTSSGKFSGKEVCSVFIITTICQSSDVPAVKGLWTTAVFDYGINAEVSALARIGFDIGDDDGLMFGAGGSYKINEKVSARLEYVIRSNYSSLQANAVFQF